MRTYTRFFAFQGPRVLYAWEGTFESVLRLVEWLPAVPSKSVKRLFADRTQPVEIERRTVRETHEGPRRCVHREKMLFDWDAHGKLVPAVKSSQPMSRFHLPPDQRR